MQLARANLSILTLFLLFISAHSFSHNYFDFGARNIPHPKKAHKGGEDAFFANNRVLAVADGVSYWNSQGIDPALYSKELCRLIGIVLGERGNLYDKPKQVIREIVERNTNKGTSTMVIASLDKKNPILRTSYVGDSLYVIYRKIDGQWKIFYEAEPQLHSFNKPFQLGYKSASHPNKALEFIHEVKDKDILVVASDGIFDNMTAEQVLKDLMEFIGENDELKNAEEAAHKIADTAYKLSLNRTYESPFAVRAVQENRPFPGGKSDDITAVVGQVKLFSEGRNQNKVVKNGNATTERREVFNRTSEESMKEKKQEKRKVLTDL